MSHMILRPKGDGWVLYPSDRRSEREFFDTEAQARKFAALLPAVVNPTKLRYVRPDRSGYLTKAELERAQGFPAGYKIVGTLSIWGQQLANAVPCELGNAIGAALAAIPS